MIKSCIQACRKDTGVSLYLKALLCASAILLCVTFISGCNSPGDTSSISKENIADTTSKKEITHLEPTTSPKLLSGPMTSIPRASSVGIWLQATSATEVAIHYWHTDKPDQPLIKSGKTDGKGILKVDIDSLTPLSEYAYQITLAGKPLENTYHFKTLVQNYFPQTHDVSFIFGSCSWWKDNHYPIMETMANHSADFMLWLGDNLYLEPSDYDRAEGIEKKYAAVRKHPSLNALLSSKGQIATWDDHDYGRNDASRDWILKADAKDTFSNYWVNPSYGTPDIPGIQTQFRLSDIDFFVLDGRSYRDNPKMNKPKQMYGSDQLRWLKNNLLNSRARLKILISGSQWINPANTFEGWNQYPQEQGDFLSWLKESQIPGVIFISGDRHMTEVIKQDRQDDYPLYDITCSPLTSVVVNKLKEIEKDNPLRVKGTLVMQHNYCEMKITGDKDNRVIDVNSYNVAGELLWNKKIHYSELGL